MIDKNAFRSLSYGLYIVTALDENGYKVGCVVNTFAQIASQPPIVSVSLNKDNVTTKAILESGKFNVSVLSQDATMDLIGTFGFRSSYDVDKFENTSYELCGGGIPYITDAVVAVFNVEVKNTLDVATHILFIGEVASANVLSGAKPLTYSYYHEVLKGKTPSKAASYNSEENEDISKENTDADIDKNNADNAVRRYGWRCTICGHIIEEEELPDDFTCPMCGMGKEYFERIEL